MWSCCLYGDGAHSGFCGCHVCEHTWCLNTSSFLHTPTQVGAIHIKYVCCFATRGKLQEREGQSTAMPPPKEEFYHAYMTFSVCSSTGSLSQELARRWRERSAFGKRIPNPGCNPHSQSLHSDSVLPRNSGGHAAEEVPSSLRERALQPWQLPALHWAVLSPGTWDGAAWWQVLQSPALGNFSRATLGLLENRESHPSSEIIWKVRQCYRLCFPLYTQCLLWYLQSICHTRDGANCLAGCYNAPHFCLLLTFCIHDLAANWLWLLLQYMVRNTWKTPSQWHNYTPVQGGFVSTTLHKLSANIPGFLHRETLVRHICL